jgi:TRAP-type C4-dicarboxylate transport system permease small subunit
LKRLLDALCGLLAGGALFAIMALTLVDVLGRKLLSRSVPGALELTEILMVVVIFAALPLVSLHREHVAFDSLDALMPARLRRLQQALIDALCAAALAGLAWLMWDKAAQLSSYGDTTAQLKLPLGLFVRLMSALCGLTALIHVLLLALPADADGLADAPDGLADTLPGGGAT